jgi:hypothetical protein
MFFYKGAVYAKKILLCAPLLTSSEIFTVLLEQLY